MEEKIDRFICVTLFLTTENIFRNLTDFSLRDGTAQLGRTTTFL